MTDFWVKNAEIIFWAILLTSGTGTLCCLGWLGLSRRWSKKENCLRIYRWLKAVIILWSWPLLFFGVRIYLKNRIEQGITDGIYFQRMFSNQLIIEGVVLVWAAGALFCGVYYLICLIRDWKHLRRLPRLMDEDWRTEAREIAAELGIRQLPDLRELPVPGSPRMTGLLQPRILIYSGDYTAQERRTILYHELCHFRYRDLWWQIGMSLMVCLNCFNPLCRCLHRQLREWGEAACDVRACEKGEIPLENYYNTVFSFCRTQTRVRATCFTRAICEEGAKETLVRRIERVKVTRRLRREGEGARRWAFSTAMAGVLCLNILLITGFGLVSDEMVDEQLVQNVSLRSKASPSVTEVSGRTVLAGEAIQIPPADRREIRIGRCMIDGPVSPLSDSYIWKSEDGGGFEKLCFDQPVVCCRFIAEEPGRFRVVILSNSVPCQITLTRADMVLYSFESEDAGEYIDLQLDAAEYWLYFQKLDQTQKEIKVMWLCGQNNQ